MDKLDRDWIAEELQDCVLLDAWLCERLYDLVSQMSGSVGAPIAQACEDWPATKAAYRFFDNDRFDESALQDEYYCAFMM